jgi:hypothetical protein
MYYKIQKSTSKKIKNLGVSITQLTDYQAIERPSRLVLCVDILLTFLNIFLGANRHLITVLQENNWKVFQENS